MQYITKTKKNEQPLVSILINNYNYERYLQQAIESAINQTYKNIEIIIVDDGSTDSSNEIINKYSHLENIKILFKSNGGQATAFNEGFKLASGEIIFFLDSDDYFLPEKVEKVIEKYNSLPDAGWLVHSLRLEDNKKNYLGASIKYRETDILYYTPEEIKHGKLSIQLPATSGLCFKRKTLEDIFPTPIELKITTDNYLKFAAATISPVILSNEELAIQRIHESNAYTAIKKNVTPSKERLILEASINFAIVSNLLDRFPDGKKFSWYMAMGSLAKTLIYNEKEIFTNNLLMYKNLSKKHNLSKQMKLSMLVFFIRCYASGKIRTVL